MKKTKVLSTIEQVKAYNDPYRMEILLNFYKLKHPATGKEIADIMGEVPSKVHYHIKKMEKAGILELADTKEINGIIAKYYQPTAEEFEIKNEYIDENSKKVMLDEVGKAISKIYDTAKFEYLDQLKKNKDSGSKKAGFIEYTGEIYLTDEERDEFRKYLNKFAESNSDKASEKKRHKLFCSMIECDDK